MLRASVGFTVFFNQIRLSVISRLLLFHPEYYKRIELVLQRGRQWHNIEKDWQKAKPEYCRLETLQTKQSGKERIKWGTLSQVQSRTQHFLCILWLQLGGNHALQLQLETACCNHITFKFFSLLISAILLSLDNTCLTHSLFCTSAPRLWMCGLWLGWIAICFLADLSDLTLSQQ